MKPILRVCPLALAALLGLILAGCASHRPPGESGALPHDPPPIGRAEALARVFGESATMDTAAMLELAATTATIAADGRVTTLTLAGVQTIARAQNPTFAEFAANRAAAQAELIAALAYPNPELEAGLGIARMREAPKDSDFEYGLGLLQALEWPGKRAARRQAAEAQTPIAQREEDIFRATLRADVAKAYHAALYYEHGVALADSALATEQRIEGIVRQRVADGEAPPIESIRARVETLRAQRAAQAQRRQLAAARSILNTLAGRALPPGFALADTLEQPLNAADAEQARQLALAQHPALRRLDAVARQRELATRREQTAWYPDLTLGLSPALGIDTRSLGASLAAALPLWDRNQGGIAAAQAELERAQAELERARQEVLRDLETGIETYDGAREQVAAFADELGAAGEALRLATFLYQEGETDLLELLDARRAARQTETEYLQARYDAHVARAELELAIGIGGVD